MINKCFKIKNQCLNHLVKITINNSCSSFVNLSAGLFKTAAHQPALILSSVKFGNYARRSPSMAFNCLARVEPSSTATKCWCACFECVCRGLRWRRQSRVTLQRRRTHTTSLRTFPNTRVFLNPLSSFPSSVCQVKED